MRRGTDPSKCLLLVAIASIACTTSEGELGQFSTGLSGDTGTSSQGSGTAGPTVGPGATDTAGSTADPTDGPTPETGDPPKLDVGSGQDPACKVGEDLDAIGSCDDQAPADSFEPEVQWSWTGQTEPQSMVMPLVANLTDDNDDGYIDLCDTPDVVVVATDCNHLGCDNDGHIYYLDGETGQETLRIETIVHRYTTPAIGDIDGDGLPEIVTVTHAGVHLGRKLVAFEHTGDLAWESDDVWSDGAAGESIALADLDNDGDVEIVAGGRVSDHLGNLLWTGGAFVQGFSATTAADLDGDGDLEVVLGHVAYHHDGTEYYLQPSIGVGYPQVADLDADPAPEVLVANAAGLTLLEHDGTIVFQDQRPSGDPVNQWHRPATVHDFDGDGISEFAVSSADHYAAYEPDLSILWIADITDMSGFAAGTAFDFLGDATAEAMYADEFELYVYDVAGGIELQAPRSSETFIEYPVVADVDNDGSAEIVVVSNEFLASTAPTVQLIRDQEDRWIQARRIWNQHTYHVTNVREDGTIPQFETPNWEVLNTFRTNAQIEAGNVCRPPQ